MQELMVNDSHNFDYYTSINEVFDVEVTEPSNAKLYDQRIVNRHFYNMHLSMLDWFGKAGGWPEVEPLMRTGWPEGLERMKGLAKTMEKKLNIPPSLGVRSSIVHRDYGDEVDMQDIYMGDYDHAWTGVERATKKVDTRFTVAIDVGGNLSEKADDLYWPGAVATVLSNVLIKSGQPVRVLACNTSRDMYQWNEAGLRDFTSVIELKSFRTPLLIDAVALTALSAFLRGCMFKAAYNQIYAVRSSVGRSSDVKDAVRQALKLPEQDHPLFISPVRSEYAAIRELKNKLTEIENFVGAR